jgi:hypothetical protein
VTLACLNSSGSCSPGCSANDITKCKVDTAGLFRVDRIWSARSRAARSPPLKRSIVAWFSHPEEFFSSADADSSDLAGTTTISAMAVPPFPPSLEVTLPVTFCFAPSVIAVTVNWKVQDPLGGRVAPDRLMRSLPATAVSSPSAHEPTRPLGLETTRPVGRTSVKPISVSFSFGLGLLIVKVSLVVLFSAMLCPPNSLVMLGGTTVLTGSGEAVATGLGASRDCNESPRATSSPAF